MRSAAIIRLRIRDFPSSICNQPICAIILGLSVLAKKQTSGLTFLMNDKGKDVASSLPTVLDAADHFFDEIDPQSAFLSL